MFAGIGGFRTGLTNAGDFFMPVGWCEKDKHAQKAYRLLYVDVAVTVMIVAFVLVFAVNVVSLVALNQNLKTVSDQITDYATLNGTVAVDGYATELKKQTGIDFGYSFDGSQLYDASGKVQLGDRIICTITYQLRMPGFGDFVLPISLKASSSGLSQVYWK